MLPLQTAIGHWSEMFFPLFSILRQETAFRRPPTQFMLLHLKRVHLMEWARAVMSVALGVKANADLPPMLMQQETDSVWTQIRKHEHQRNMCISPHFIHICQHFKNISSNLLAPCRPLDPLHSECLGEGEKECEFEMYV